MIWNNVGKNGQQERRATGEDWTTWQKYTKSLHVPRPTKDTKPAKPVKHHLQGGGGTDVQ